VGRQGAGVAPQAIQGLVAGGGTGAQGVEQSGGCRKSGIHHWVDRQADFQLGEGDVWVVILQRLIVVDHVLRRMLHPLRGLLGDGVCGVGLAGDFANHLQQLHILRGDVGIAGRERPGSFA